MDIKNTKITFEFPNPKVNTLTIQFNAPPTLIYLMIPE